MQYSTALTDAILALACFACTFAISKVRKSQSEALQAALFCALLGFLLPAVAASAGVIHFGFDPAAQAAHAWLTQASTFLGFPLLGAAALSISMGWNWSRANWGRLLLGLCAFFELFRQMDHLDDYRLAISLGTLLMILVAGLRQWPNRQSLIPAVAAVALFAIAGLAVGTHGLMGAVHRVDLFHILLSIAYPLLLWLLTSLTGRLAKHRSEENR
ncbi:DUF6962 family protein [Pseudomonas sp. TTU2014-080ASC]|uniref:DUF6962 family protein n=1 Tax=Pseudomonas sp. TTU2014-080ASC TaxID=1729724 RepID=UPI0007185578|nr:hypothetical protein [Pseudomonas sp. TTU2014-080ASC]KRW62776.1 hypothetical protein AO726_04975 [Pseudomonas sp. TTU2014-080ASC]